MNKVKIGENKKTLAELPALLDSLPRLSVKELEDFAKDLNESSGRIKKLDKNVFRINS